MPASSPMPPLRTAAVIGAGTMGRQIAALLAGFGIRVLLFDQDRARAAAALYTLKKDGARVLYCAEDAARIEALAWPDDRAALAACDWCIEAVPEDLAAKREVLRDAAEALPPQAILTTNTSGLSLQALSDALPATARARFAATHFFNPPRHVRLVELAPGPETTATVRATLERWLAERLGKVVVPARDTPNFIANRLNVFSRQWLLHQAPKAGLSVEALDLLTGPLIGHGRSATCGTLDHVGLTTYGAVLATQRGIADDPAPPEHYDLPDCLRALKAANANGAPATFYRKTEARDENGRRVREVFDWHSGAYRPEQPVTEYPSLNAARDPRDPAAALRPLYDGDDAASVLFRRWLLHWLDYGARVVGAIAAHPADADAALRAGGNRALGLFECMDTIGRARVLADLAAAGLDAAAVVRAVEASAGGEKQRHASPTAQWLTRRMDAGHVVAEDEACALVDLGERVLGAAFRTKMGAIDRAVLEALERACDRVDAGAFDALVLGHEGPHFSAGANLARILDDAREERFDVVDDTIRRLQQTGLRLKYLRAPVVAALRGYVLGGGMELALQCDARVATPETWGGLVETAVGLIPAGGGLKEMLLRAQAPGPMHAPLDPLPPLRKAFEQIATARRSASAMELRAWGYGGPWDRIAPRPEALLFEAREHALGRLRTGYAPPAQPRIALPEPDLRAVLEVDIARQVEAGTWSDDDAFLARHVAGVLCGEGSSGDVVEEAAVLDAERAAFLECCARPETHARIEHMLKTGKPLRN